MHDADVLKGVETEKSGSWLSRLFAPLVDQYRAAKDRVADSQTLEQGLQEQDMINVFFDAYIEGYDTSEGGIKIALDRILRENHDLAESGFTTDEIYDYGVEHLANLEDENPQAKIQLDADRSEHHANLGENAL